MAQDQDSFQIVSTGKITEGVSRSEVTERLVSHLKLTPAQAAEFFDRQRVLKKNVSKTVAQQFAAKLAKIGVATRVIPVVAPRAEAPVPPHRDPFSTEGLSLVEDSPKTSIESAAAGQPTTHSADPSVAGGDPYERTFTPDGFANTEVPKVDTESQPELRKAPKRPASGLTPAALVAAGVAALVGAWVWKFVGIQFGRDLGLFAWAIGGAVGATAAALGSRGTAAGVVCGVLVVASIGLGKYWTYAAFTNELQAYVSEIDTSGDEMRAYYEEEREDARLLVAGSGSDQFLRQYMVERGYTDASDPSRVRASELSEFREYIEPELREFASNQPSFAEWRGAMSDLTDELSPMAMMTEGLGVLDIVFLLLGVSTAFRLGSQ